MTAVRDESGRSAESQASGAFMTTHWTQVLAARGESPEAKDALRELCAAYYAPVHAFIRQWRHGADDARYYGVFVWVLAMLEQWFKAHRVSP